MRVSRFSVWFVVLLIALLSLGFLSDVYFKINKSFEIFSSVFRLISDNYVIDIEPEILVKSGIKGMLNTLDPYSEYYDAKDSEDLEFLSNATYTGLGISVSEIDSMLTITNVRDGYPASKSGIQVGDKIYSVDSVVVINQSSEYLRNFTRGKAGTILKMRTIRVNKNDTIELSITRENIKIDNISYSGFIGEGIGFIKLDRFTRTTASDLRKSISELRKSSNLKGLLIDLRDNPGGLLDAAVSVCEVFLPEKSLVVTTKTRNETVTGTFNTISKPTEPEVPLAVLINEGSASASEIVAGAIQDYDRGLIIGNKSFGKGLVQSVFEVPFNGNIKLTTSKYYTPSGRCIQKLDFAELYHEKGVRNNQDTNIFRTKNGRTVYELTGIIPDTIVLSDIDNPIVQDMLNRFVIFKFVNFSLGEQTAETLLKLESEKIFKSFTKYLNQINYKPQTDIYRNLEMMKKQMNDIKYSQKTFDIAKQFEVQIDSETRNILEKNKTDIINLIRYEIYSRLPHQKEKLDEIYRNDNVVKVTKEIILSDLYKKILVGNYHKQEN